MVMSKLVNGTLNNADPVEDNINFALSRLIEYGLDGADTTNQANAKFDLFVTDTSQSSTMWYDALNDWFRVDLGVGDDFDDNIVTDWTNSGTVTVTESAGSMFATSGNATNSTGYTIMDNDIFANTSYFESRVRLAVSVDTRTASIYISDGTNEVLVKTVNTIVGADISNYRFHKVDANSIEWWDDGAAQSDLDTSGLVASTERYIKLYVATGLSGRADINNYYMFECDSSWNYVNTACTMVGNALTVTTSETYILINSVYNGTVPTLEGSFNGGSNYTTLTNQDSTTIANVGTSAQIRFSYAATTFTYTNKTTTTMPRVESYGYYYS